MGDGRDVLPAEARQVLDFWFEESSPEQWFKRDAAFDATIRERFGALRERGAAGELDGWSTTAEGCVALVIVLDQFPRNLFRDDPRAFATDEKARGILRRALDRGFDKALSWRQRQFLYMPLQHSEQAADQALSVALYATLGNDEVLKFARAHKEIIDRFGRFPHRNSVLGRKSSRAELAFLARPGSSF